MAIYVDPAIHPWRNKMWCHLTADNDEELHAFAAKLGLKRSWFQSPPKSSIPHYDITENKRAQAVQLGAIELDIHQAAQRIRDCRKTAIAPNP